MSPSGCRPSPASYVLPTFVAVVLALVGCAPAEGMPCRASDRKCGKEERDKHPLRFTSAWQSTLAKPLHERVAVGDASAVTFVALDNIAGGFTQRPRLASPSTEIQREVAEVLAELPRAVADKLSPKLVGVLFVEDFGGSALTQSVLNDQQMPGLGMIILDPTALERRTANQWASWRESTPFVPDGSTKIHVQIETPENDTRKNALRYLLLHEIGHVLSIGQAFHPPWGMSEVTPAVLGTYPFASLSWMGLDRRNGLRSKFEDVMPRRRDVVFYFGAKLKFDVAHDLYRQLSVTSYPTLYASTSWEEDFAESFANYVHVVVSKRPYEARIERDSVVMGRFGHCWDEARCRAKRSILESYLALPVGEMRAKQP